MEKHVYIVRHGESESNVSKIYSGRSAQLTEKGRTQAQLVAERVRNLNVDALLCSTYPRAIDTAAYISDKIGLKAEQEEVFGELIAPTHLTGVSNTNPEFIETFRKINEMAHDPHFRLHDEETFDEISDRGRKALELLSAHPKNRICVVTHGGFLRVLVGLVLFGDTFTRRELNSLSNNFRTINTGITYIQHTHEGWKLLTLNDHAHLG